jgi:hypothetical protein
MYGHTGPLPDRAYPRLIGQVLPAGLCGLMLAVLFGAVMSCLDSMLHAASTIFTMDFVKRGKRRAPSDRSLVWIGRLMAALFVVIGCGSATLATQIGGGLLDSVETILGYISPGVMAVFVFGLVSKRAPAAAATGAMLLGIPVYAWLLWMLPEIAFFYHVAFTFIALVAYMMFVTILLPLRDVLASGAEEQAAEPPSGFVRRLLIPYGTAILGGLLFAMPVFVYSHVVTVKYQLPDWAHFTSAGVVLMVWVLVTVVLLARPALAVRKVTALARRPSFVRGVGRWLGRLIGVVILAAVLGLHVYLLGTWVTAKLPVTAQTVDWLKPCVAWLEPYATESFDVTLPAVVRKRPQAETLVFVPQQPLPEKPGAKEEAEGEKVTGGAKAAPKAQAPALPPIEPPARWPHLESEVQQQRALGGGFTYQTRRMPLFLLPLGLTAVIVGLFLIGVVLLWFQPAPGEADLPVTNKIDLAPGAFVHGWGVIILVLIGGLYWLFF